MAPTRQDETNRNVKKPGNTYGDISYGVKMYGEVTYGVVSSQYLISELENTPGGALSSSIIVQYCKITRPSSKMTSLVPNQIKILATRHLETFAQTSIMNE
jgi:hypothetical protein